MEDVTVLREARREDVAAMHRVRMSVLENRLVSRVLSEGDYVQAIEVDGRGWVVECEGAIVAFAVGSSTSGNLWALFVHPAHEAQGHGRRLHDAMVAWLWQRGLERLWLTTEPGTRAQRFYERAGWTCVGRTAEGELRFELMRPGAPPPAS